MKTSIIGAGTMGTGIAQLFAGYGYNVTIIDKKPAAIKKSLEFIKARLKGLEDDGKIEDRKIILKRIVHSTDMNDAKGSTVVIEAVNENLKLKKQIFKQLEKVCDRKTILASNTSSLSITQIGAGLHNIDRVVGLHFFNPATKMQLVEICKAQKTSATIMRRCHNFVESLGKYPIIVKDTPGLIVNRLLIPMINDAAKLVEKKVAGFEDIDRAVRLGASHPMGPFQLADLVGIDTCVDILRILAKETKNKNLLPSRILTRKVKKKHLGKKTKIGFYDY